MCGRPRGRPASAHSQPRQPRGRLCSGGELGAGAARSRGKADPAELGLVTRLRVAPPLLTPYFLPLAETASLSLFPATEFMVAFPEERICRFHRRYIRRSPARPRGDPGCRGLALGPQGKVSSAVGREATKANGPTSNSSGLQRGLGPRVYSSLPSMLFLIPSASSSRTFSCHGHSPRTGIFFRQVGPRSRTREGRAGVGARGRCGRWAGRAEPSRAGCGNLSPSPSLVTEFKEILPKYKDPDSGRSLGVSPSQYPLARFA